MKELWELIKTFNVKKIMLTPTNNFFVQLFRYCFVGGIAFVADWGSLFIFAKVLHINDFLSTAIAFIIGLIVNFILSKLFVFAGENKVNGVVEFAVYAMIGVIGLGLTELLIYIGTKILFIDIMLAKIAAAIIVLLWNFIARKLTLYRRKSA